MAEHPNATVVRAMNDAMASGDMEGAAARVADDVVWHEIGRAQPRRGKAELAASMGEFADYDITWEVHDVLASDDHVIGLGTATVTKKGGGSLTYRTAEIYHVKNGQVTERWAFSDDTKAITDFFG
jgi:ketosteroid isomerase-like protein